jgi:chromate transporter
MHFLVTLGLAGMLYAFTRRGEAAASPPLALLLLIPFLPLALSVAAPGILVLFGYGLRSGLLTFGGAYTVIPFLQHDAVVAGGWMTNEQFLDGLALSSILPAPLIIFATFVGYLGGGPVGALALTAGIFLPAFGFTLAGHTYFEKLIENKTTHAFLDGVTAGVVGLIAATTIGLLRAAVTDLPAALICAAALIVLGRWKAKAAVAVVVLGAGLLGLALRPL